MISSPSGPYLRCIEFSHGNERRHGTHQDAQKSTQTTRPWTGASAGGGAARAPPLAHNDATASDNKTFKRTTPPCPDRATAAVGRAVGEKPVAASSARRHRGRRSRYDNRRGRGVLRVVTAEPLRFVGAVTP